MKKLLFQFIFIISIIPVNAQLKTLVGIETGPSWNLIRISDNSGYLNNTAHYGTFGEFSIEQELFSGFYMGTGISIQNFFDGIRWDDDRPGHPSWQGFNAIEVPVRVLYRIRIEGYPAIITPSLGYIYGSVTFPGNSYSASSILSAPDGTVFNYSLAQSNGNSHMHLFEAGLSVGFNFGNDWQTGLGIRYAAGFSMPLSTEVLLTDQTAENHTSVGELKGDNLKISLNLAMPLSNLWQQREQRLRKRIEKTYGGSRVKESKEIYFGVETGALWRYFQYSNPAITPRSIEKKGFLHYADFVAGGYAGIMLGSFIGLDAGVYYRASNSYFAVMYDHEEDLSIKENAPMFLEVPVRLRYFIPVIRDKVDIVSLIGGSVLTHFSSGNYGSGSGTFTYTHPQNGPEMSGTIDYRASRISSAGATLRAGLGIEYRLPLYFPVITTLYAAYDHGYMKLDEIEVSTGSSIVDTGEIPELSSIIYRGNGFSLMLGARVPFILDPKGKSTCGRLPRIR